MCVINYSTIFRHLIHQTFYFVFNTIAAQCAKSSTHNNIFNMEAPIGGMRVKLVMSTSINSVPTYFQRAKRFFKQTII